MFKSKKRILEMVNSLLRLHIIQNSITEQLEKRITDLEKNTPQKKIKEKKN